ncbi:purine permease [Paracoccus suum]|uniref:Purine permease n=1 Tax=Paracoccus suum TaxID=2259340 RepID=A0A344PPJ2_9RHOB|nr:nucleobase:cation symporter-2 family protein [Paracoccus suum]AXC51297.1 purine permease [Paracoccus suum]
MTTEAGAGGVHAVDAMLPTGRLMTLGLQHVLVMYAGAVAVPLIVGRALKLPPEDVAFLISADLFVCGLATIIQSAGLTQWFGVRLPVMMGVTFAAVGPMVAIGATHPGTEGARMIFGAIIAAGIVSMLIAPLVSRIVRFFPPVVTGTIILVIGVTLMRIGINWIFGNPVGPTAPKLVTPEAAAWMKHIAEMSGTGTVPTLPSGLNPAPSMPNPAYASPVNISISALVLVTILMIARFGRGFIANIAVLMGIVVGAVVTILTGQMTFGKAAAADWFGIITPFHFGAPIFDPVMILTMVLVMIVVMIESIGMFLALGTMTGRPVDQPTMSAGLRTDGLGTLLGGIFNTFPYTSFSQNVGLVGVTGIRSRWVCVAGGVILMVFGLVPKMGALVESLPTAVLGGAGIVMFGMVAATGVRILASVDFTRNRNNLFVVAVALGFGMIPLVAPDFKQWLPHGIHPLIESGILLATIAAVIINAFFNGVQGTAEDAARAARVAGH